MEKDIIEFLIRAKKATYAGKGAETESSNGSREQRLSVTVGRSFMSAASMAVWLNDIGVFLLFLLVIF